MKKTLLAAALCAATATAPGHASAQAVPTALSGPQVGAIVAGVLLLGAALSGSSSGGTTTTTTTTTTGGGS